MVANEDSYTHTNYSQIIIHLLYLFSIRPHYNNYNKRVVIVTDNLSDHDMYCIEKKRWRTRLNTTIITFEKVYIVKVKRIFYKKNYIRNSFFFEYQIRSYLFFLHFFRSSMFIIKIWISVVIFFRLYLLHPFSFPFLCVLKPTHRFASLLKPRKKNWRRSYVCITYICMHIRARNKKKHILMYREYWSHWSDEKQSRLTFSFLSYFVVLSKD